MRKSRLSTMTLYIHDLDDHIIAETDASGTTLREYIWVDDLPLAIVANANVTPAIYYVHTDHLLRPARMTDNVGAVAWDVIYKPFGEVNNVAIISAATDLRFPGQWFQLESGLHYNWHRHYDPTTGRYIQPDPLGLTALRSDGPSAYNYVGGSPLAWVDSEGYAKDKYEKPPNPNKRKGADERQPGNNRERNVGHPEGEEHSIKPKGGFKPRGVPTFRIGPPWILLPNPCIFNPEWCIGPNEANYSPATSSKTCTLDKTGDAFLQ